MILVIFLSLILIFLMIILLSEEIYDLYDYIKCFYNKIKLKITPEYKSKIKNIELSTSDKLDKLNIKDVESVLKYYKLDYKVKGVTFDMNPKDIETYLRKKKIKKLK